MHNLSNPLPGGKLGLDPSSRTEGPWLANGTAFGVAVTTQPLSLAVEMKFPTATTLPILSIGLERGLLSRARTPQPAVACPSQAALKRYGAGPSWPPPSPLSMVQTTYQMETNTRPKLGPDGACGGGMLIVNVSMSATLRGPHTWGSLTITTNHSPWVGHWEPRGFWEMADVCRPGQ